MIRGSIAKIKNTQKRSNFESDYYFVTLVETEDGTYSGLMLTEKELKTAIKRFWKNTEDHPKINKHNWLGKLINSLFN